MICLENADVYLKSLVQQEGLPVTEEITSALVTINQRDGMIIFSSLANPDVNLKSRLSRVKFFTIENSDYFPNLHLVDIDCHCQIPLRANWGMTDRRIPLLYHDDTLVVFPINAAIILKHRGCRSKKFYAPQGRCPDEIVARVDRGGIRRLFSSCLRFFLNRRGLPYIHLSYVPVNCKSIFGFRVDTDYTPVEVIERCVEIARSTNTPWTWFVMTSCLDDNQLKLQELLFDQDIQVHCHRHVVFPDMKRNITNFYQAIEKLKVMDIYPVGVAAPFGEWHHALNQAFVELGFSYSSEFCYTYDDVPSRPIVNGKYSAILQIPIHPVSIGRLIPTKMNDCQMIDYFRNVIDIQVARREPCFLYDHPATILKFPSVIKEVVKYGLERCGSGMTMTEFYHWWQQREKVKYNYSIENNVLELRVTTSAPDVDMTLEYNNSLARIPLSSGKYKLDKLNWQPVEIVPSPPDLIKIRQYPLRMQIQYIARRAEQKCRNFRNAVY